MCQCLCGECCWLNCCKLPCLGCGCNSLCCSIWVCKPEEVMSFDYNCIVCCEKVGLGLVCPIFAWLMCPPEWVGRYSKKKNAAAVRYQEESV